MNPSRDTDIMAMIFRIRSLSDRRTVASAELRQGENVSFRVGEPGHPVPARRGPDAALVLRQALVALELHTTSRQPVRQGGDVVDAPAEDGVAGCRDAVDRGDPQHRPAGVEDAGELVLLEQPQAENPLVEATGTLEVGAGREGDDRRCPEHRGTVAAGRSARV